VGCDGGCVGCAGCAGCNGCGGCNGGKGFLGGHKWFKKDSGCCGGCNGCGGCDGGCMGCNGCNGCNGGRGHKWFKRSNGCGGCDGGCGGGCGGCAGCVGCAGGSAGYHSTIIVMPKADSAVAQSAAPATIVVSLPAEAKLSIDGNSTTSTSERRVFVSPTLEAGQEYYYTLKAELNGQVKEERVTVKAGQEVTVKIEIPAASVAAK
jgi:uncharacterized protein (TIGR03000 family)